MPMCGLQILNCFVSRKRTFLSCFAVTCLVRSDKILLVIRKISLEESKSRMSFTYNITYNLQLTTYNIYLQLQLLQAFRHIRIFISIIAWSLYINISLFFQIVEGKFPPWEQMLHLTLDLWLFLFQAGINNLQIVLGDDCALLRKFYLYFACNPGFEENPILVSALQVRKFCDYLGLIFCSFNLQSSWKWREFLSLSKQKLWSYFS